jgi:hypothetical protein
MAVYRDWEAVTSSLAEEALQTMAQALTSGDRVSQLRILGHARAEMLSSENDLNREEQREHKAREYEQIQLLVNEEGGNEARRIDAGAWPTLIRLTHQHATRAFDTEAEKREIAYRRMGENELTAIEICHEWVNARKKNDTRSHNRESLSRHLQSAFIDRGEHNGLCQKSESGEGKCSYGQLVVLAESESNTGDVNQKPQSFHGYRFRGLQGRGSGKCKASRGFPVGELADNDFALLAYPEEYRSTGVMTFLVGQDGVVYEEDLGRKTAQIAKSIARFSRDKTWQEAEAGPFL